MSRGKDYYLESKLKTSLHLVSIPMEGTFLLLLFLEMEHTLLEVMGVPPAVALGITENAI